MLLILIILPLVGFFALFLLLLLIWLLIIDRLVVLHLLRVAKEVTDLFLALLLVHHLLFIDAVIFLFRQVVFFAVLTFNDILLIFGVFSFVLYFFSLFSIIGVLELLLVVVLVLGLSLHLLIDFHPIGAIIILG